MATAVKAPSGRKIWKAVRDELMLNLYPLPFSTIAPAVYHVYLHPDDFDAIDGVAARVVAQIQQALTAEVEKVNRGLRRSSRRVLSRLLDREDCRRSRCRRSGWEVHFCAIATASSNAASSASSRRWPCLRPPEYAGTPTTRIVRSVVGGGRRTADEDAPVDGDGAGRGASAGDGRRDQSRPRAER